MINESKWSMRPVGKNEGLFCHCGEISFVTKIVNNPIPTEPNPCYEHFLEVVKIRKAQMQEAIENGKNRNE
jgi:hypothetical protein